MYLYKAVIKVLALEFFFCCVFIKNLICQTLDNPWENFMKRFDIPNNHKSGVKNDLEGNIESDEVDTSGNKLYYKYPIGRCPVFGKYLDTDFELNLNGLNEKSIQQLLLKGELPNIKNLNNVNPYKTGENLNFNAVKLKLNTEYKDLESPIKAESIYECAQYAKRFVHKVKNIKKKENIITHPFFYSLHDKLCYVLFPLLQEFNKDNKIIQSKKDTMSVVYGTTNIPEDWIEHCPTKPIISAKFGYWNGKECIEKSVKEFSTDFRVCALYLFNEKNIEENKENENKKNLINYWANYDYKTNNCKILRDKPNCLIYSENSHSITSLSIIRQFTYDLPPCIKSSIGWKINATCENLVDKLFTCSESGYWETNDGDKITICKSENVEENFDFELNQIKSNNNNNANPTTVLPTVTINNSYTVKFSRTNAIIGSIGLFIVYALFF